MNFTQINSSSQITYSQVTVKIFANIRKVYLVHEFAYRAFDLTPIVALQTQCGGAEKSSERPWS